MKRKWLSMLLALALVFSLAPAMALAEDRTVNNDTELQAAIADTSVNKIILLPGISLLATLNFNEFSSYFVHIISSITVL